MAEIVVKVGTENRWAVDGPAGPMVIEDIAYHRNGVGGVGFNVVLFAEPREERRMMAVVYPIGAGTEGNGDEYWNGLVSVFNRTLLANDVIAFGENSWRGDEYEAPLRAVIAAYDAAGA